MHDDLSLGLAGGAESTMRTWWVNQNQTFRQEQAGGYMWSPKRKSNGHRNPFYDTMRAVAPGDKILCFKDTKICAVGVAESNAYDAPRPTEFGEIGTSWAEFGWRVDVTYQRVEVPIRPKDHIEVLRPLLPGKYSPLQQSGDGLQQVYVTAVPTPLAQKIDELLNAAGNSDLRPPPSGRPRRDEVISEAEDRIEAEIPDQETEKESLIKSRRGQGKFKNNVEKLETTGCRFTGVRDPAFLVASHIKPWRQATNRERLDGSNGFLLTPTFDRLFDRGYISLNDEGCLLISPSLDPSTRDALNVPEPGFETGPLNEAQRSYLTFHRQYIFLDAESR